MFRISRRTLHWLRFLPGFRQISLDGVHVDLSELSLQQAVVKGLLDGSYKNNERLLAKSVLQPRMRVVEIGAG